MCFQFFLLVVLAYSVYAFEDLKFEKHFEWNILDFVYPDDASKLQAIMNGKLKPKNALPVGIEFWKDKIFITVPRWQDGIPSTLNYIPFNSEVKNPSLIPYPDLQSNELGNCQGGLSTVYRIHVDQCDRLWVLDTGTFGIEDTTQNVCPYALNIFDLQTDKRIHRYVFKTTDINGQTFIANIAVELGNDCDEGYAYFSDELGYGLIVYSLKDDQSWRFEHNFFMPDPLKGNFNIDGLNFQWGQEGIFGISLSPQQTDGYRTLYFSPLASNREFAVSTKILHNPSRVNDSYHEFVVLEERGKDTHTTARIISNHGIQFFNLIDQNAVGCWDIRKPYSPKNIGVIERHPELIFPADIKIDKNNYLWVLSDRMPKFLLSTLNYSEPNFRLFFAPAEPLIKNTVCEPVPKPVHTNPSPIGLFTRNPDFSVEDEAYLKTISSLILGKQLNFVAIKEDDNTKPVVDVNRRIDQF